MLPPEHSSEQRMLPDLSDALRAATLGAVGEVKPSLCQFEQLPLVRHGGRPLRKLHSFGGVSCVFLLFGHGGDFPRYVRSPTNPTQLPNLTAS